MINVNFIIAQVLGVVATLIMCMSYNAENKKNFLFLGLFGDVIYGITFLFIGSLGAGIIAIVSCLQYLLISFFDKKSRQIPKIIVLMFITIFIVIGYFMMESYWDIIPIVTYVWFSIILCFKDIKTIKIMYVFPNVLLTIYDFMVMAYASALEDGFEAIYLLVMTNIEFIKTRKKQEITIKNATQKKLSYNFMTEGKNPYRYNQSNVVKDNFKIYNKIIKSFMRTISVKELHPPPMVVSCHNIENTWLKKRRDSVFFLI